MEDHDYNSYIAAELIIKYIDCTLIRQINVHIYTVNFGTRHKETSHYVNELLTAYAIRIHTTLNNALAALRIAQVKDTWNLDKEQRACDDILDALRLSLLNYFFEPN
jgi:3'-phosphoadenosine 5'-phosphosulfate sulfotransferase (PAPS reductase)/FAD synthetase